MFFHSRGGLCYISELGHYLIAGVLSALHLLLFCVCLHSLQVLGSTLAHFIYISDTDITPLNSHRHPFDTSAFLIKINNLYNIVSLSL